MTLTATLQGTATEPILSLTVPYTNTQLRRALKHHPGCTFHPATKTWHITDEHPLALLNRWHITLDTSGVNYTITDATTPLIYLHPTNPNRILINPRLSGSNHIRRTIAPAHNPDPHTGWIEADILVIADQQGHPIPGIHCNTGVTQALHHAFHTRVTLPRTRTHHNPDATLLATSHNPDDPHVAAALTRLTNQHPLPDWFGLPLYPFQLLGAQAATAGHRLICDSPRLGKTRQALAVTAITHRQRTLIISPPVGQTGWLTQANDAHLGAIDTHSGTPSWMTDTPHHPTGSPAANGARIVHYATGRKPRPLPTHGVVILTDSLLVSRPTLTTSIQDWQPDMIIYDEAHRARTWDSKRTHTLRTLIHTIRHHNPNLIVLTLTGTPTPSGSPMDLAPALDMIGHLDLIYAGLGNYARRYATPQWFGGYTPNPATADRLDHTLTHWSRIRRHKTDVMPWLPTKQRTIDTIDPDMTAYHHHLATLHTTITTWATTIHDTTGHWPTPTDIDDWAALHPHYNATLRIATATAKIPWTTHTIRTNLDTQTPTTHPDGHTTWDEPQLIWIWHKDVAATLAATLAHTHPTGIPYTAIILDGSTPDTTRGRIITAFENHTIPILICQISAIGVSVTLNACPTPIFLETDWLPDLNLQAEERSNSPGQTRPVTIHITYAPGTTDDHLFKTAALKARHTASISTTDPLTTTWPKPDVPLTQLLTHEAHQVIHHLTTKKPPTRQPHHQTHPHRVLDTP